MTAFGGYLVAVAIQQAVVKGATEPVRALCPDCLAPVLMAVVGDDPILAELYEWQPRSRCFPCAGAQATSKSGRVHCSRCGGSGFIGEKRPDGPMLAIDVAWSDEGNLRVITARTPRRRGEGLHAFHTCAPR